MQPGEHVAIFAADAEAGLEGRQLGLELRDTILVLSPGPKASFIFLFRKPIAENTVAEQMAITGTGGLNIEACRTGPNPGYKYNADRNGTTFHGQQGERRVQNAEKRGVEVIESTAGRWPPNVVLVHGPGCRRTGTRRIPTGGSGVAATVHASAGYQGPSLGKDSREDGDARPCHRNDDGTETIPAWSCESGCPVLFLDGQSGELQSGIGTPGSSAKFTGNTYAGDKYSLNMKRSLVSYGDTGGASRFFSQFKDEAELRAWIERLISPIQ